MRTYILAALTVALVSAPAWADRTSVPVRTGSTSVHYNDGNVAVKHGHGNKHGSGHGPGFIPSTRPGPGYTIQPYPGGHNHGHRHGQHCRWMPGHHETFYRQVWVQGHYENRYVPAEYRKQIYNGVAQTVCVREAHYAQIWVPGHYTTVTDRRWCEGYWTCHRHW
ncbi:MAG: hypothetical protein SGI88_16345 [Candidatus Hydrogenedentes bacterium]|nr:hypothetical protein [Candidatus Hydrogenedentota bacterium]